MTEPDNPYAAPQSRTPHAVPAAAADAGISLLPEPLGRNAGEGANWIGDGWRLCKRQLGLLAGMTFVFGLVYMIVAGLLSLIPIAGGIAAMAFSVVFLSSFTLVMDRLYRGETASFDDLFSAFRHPARTRLALLGVVMGVLYLILGFVAAWLAGALQFWQAATGLSGEDPGVLLANGTIGWMPVLLYVLYGFLLSVPLMMALWFTGALVLFNNMQPIPALGWSFRACLRNLLPLTVYSLLLWLLALATLFTLFIGLLVWVPLFVASWYVSYRRICTPFPAAPIE